MTKDEALKLAFEALEGVLDDAPKVLDASIAGGLYEVVQCRDAITAIKQALAEPEQEPSNTRLCRSCNGTGDQDTGIAESPIATCKPCKGTGQIALAQPEERNFCPRCGKRTAIADLVTIHTCTPPHDNALQRGLSKTKEVVAGSQAFYGFPDGPVSTPNAGGKCVTAGETAPKEST